MKKTEEDRGVRNTEEVIQILEKTDPKHGILFSLDVKAMFPSIKRDFVFRCVREMIEEEGQNKLWLIELLEWILENSYCKDGETSYKIKEGLPIGSKLSPVLAEIVIRKWEKKAKKEGGRKLEFFCHYVDDVLGNWRGTLRELSLFQKKLDCPEMGIETEKVVESDGKIQFLDVEIVKTTKGIGRRW